MQVYGACRSKAAYLAAERRTTVRAVALIVNGALLKPTLATNAKWFIEP
jgi:hypothetical protein